MRLDRSGWLAVYYLFVGFGVAGCSTYAGIEISMDGDRPNSIFSSGKDLDQRCQELNSADSEPNENQPVAEKSSGPRRVEAHQQWSAEPMQERTYAGEVDSNCKREFSIGRVEAMKDAVEEVSLCQKEYYKKSFDLGGLPNDGDNVDREALLVYKYYFSCIFKGAGDKGRISDCYESKSDRVATKQVNEIQWAVIEEYFECIEGIYDEEAI